ncbi:granulocyte-macrophage colony-stimulating factor receptor subunit alpha-like [Antechinus flavipes]|uniref:granulocyte-macrophage colony-stimulating factor receptor subunit alpha-like n=1 Tax=Antechinus flavipes TaxID=38775 RepID=UPI0022355D63|nr:granulocyte-macrophage colony-stimulating factor receptor subunit alpha-like [Antechinus flavipes]
MTYFMDDLMAFIWISILLTSVYCLTEEQEDLAAKVSGLSVTISKKDPKRVELTWDNSDNITTPTSVMQTLYSPVMDMDYIKKVCCHFSNCNLNHGGEDTAAKNFSCIVYNIYFMNCTWTVGKAAPNDVQYYLYSQNAEKKQERECTNYIKDSHKRHVGCHFDELDGFRGKAYFLVTGSSKRIKIKNFCSEKISLFSIEKYNAPSNITVNCSKSNCLIQWQKPKTRIDIGDSEFKYMLCIQKLGSQYTNDTEIKLPGSTKNEYVFTNFDTEKRYILKIRARHRRASWGYWSKPIEFGSSEEQKRSPIYIYILMVFGTIVFVLIIIFLFKRCHIMQKLFPPIPQIKDKVNICDHLDRQIIWEEFKYYPEKCEEIMTIDVMG